MMTLHEMLTEARRRWPDLRMIAGESLQVCEGGVVRTFNLTVFDASGTKIAGFATNLRTPAGCLAECEAQITESVKEAA